MSLKKSSKSLVVILLITLISSVFICSQKIHNDLTDNKIEDFDLKKIWSNDKHNAFTSLIYFNDKFFCAFREATGHNSKDGAIRIIYSSNGNDWLSYKKIEINKNDLRDPKLFIDEYGRLSIGVLSRYEVNGVNKHKTFVFYQENLENDSWNEYKNDVLEDTWMWCINGMDKEVYSIAYSGKDKAGTLYKKLKGESWGSEVNNFFPNVKNFPNESSLIKTDNKLVVVVRQNKGSKKGILGVEKEDLNWIWKELNYEIGSPQLIRLPNKKILLAARLYNPIRTSLCVLDVDNASLKEVLSLPSGRDTGYPGMIIKNNEVFISYYSNHEDIKGKSSIYLARINLEKFNEKY